MSNSDSLKEKIATLRSKIGAVSKNKENPFFNSQYFDINQLLEHLQPHLDDIKLNITQPLRDGAVVTVIEDLESDEMRESELELPAIDNPQKMGSAITYYRRYTLKSLLAIQEEDDDGNKATKGKKTSKNGSYDDKPWLNKTEYKSDELTDDWKKVVKRVRNNPDDLPKVYDHFKVNKECLNELESIAEKVKAEKEPALNGEGDEPDLPF